MRLMVDISQQVKELVDSQRKAWELAAVNYQALDHIVTRVIDMGDGAPITVQCNPARIVSSAAKVDTQSLVKRACFLCQNNLPDVQQGIPFGDRYMILCNPFPIFNYHLTIPTLEHTDQRIKDSIRDMMELTMALESFTLFYNGPKCGASAPDHAHFQAAIKGVMPIEHQYKIYAQTGELLHIGKRSLIILDSEDIEDIVTSFERLYDRLSLLQPNEPEPMLNLVAWYDQGRYLLIVYPRAQHRPSCFFAQAEDQILLSPASVDMAGLLITPRMEDFEKIKPSDIETIFSEVCLQKLD